MRSVLFSSLLAATVSMPLASTAAPPPTTQQKSEAIAVSEDAEGLEEEKRLLGQARERDKAGDPEGALVSLDSYLTSYGHDGKLRFEAVGLMVEILRRLERNGEALEELDPLKLKVDQAMLLVERGELRAGAGRYSEALGDFNTALGKKELPPELHERALYGRAMAKLKTGDVLAARAEFRECVRLYPNGRFAKNAAKLARVSTQGPKDPPTMGLD